MTIVSVVSKTTTISLVTVGGVVASWIDKARRPLHFDMPIEDGAPLAVVPHLMTDNHHSHGILSLLPDNFIINGSMWK
jgi:hypothetical protein